VGQPTTAPSTTWVYAGEATDDYPDTSASIDNSVKIGGKITLTAQTQNKLSLKLGDPQTATECWVALYSFDTPGNRLAYATISSPAVGWNDVTISYASSATDYVVWAACNQAYKIKAKSAGSGPNYYNTDTGYNSTPPATMARTDDTGSNGLRVGY
jgi:hypothetical protein